MKRRTVLVTGAAGFLGSHISKYHLNRGDRVVGVDNHSTSLGPDSAHLNDLLNYDSFVFEEVDICYTKTSHYEHYLSRFDGSNLRKYDLIYNAACPASPPRYQALALETLSTCTVGTRNVLELARVHDATMIQFSTSEVYGDPEISPQPESYWGHVNSYGCRSCYDEGKRVAEAFCYEYNRIFGCDIRLVRIFNTYGENMDADDGRVITNFVKQAIRNEDITIYGTGKQTRSFCYVSDLVSAITGIAELPRNPGTPVNVGNPYEFDMLELAEIVLKAVPGTTSKIVFKPLPGDDPTQRRPDITKVKRLLPWWDPQVTLQEGIERMVTYMRDVLNTNGDAND